jgi:hypothetical protein
MWDWLSTNGSTVLLLLLVLICPLMHAFGRHGHKHGHGEPTERRADER